MMRTNTFVVRPHSEDGERVLRDLLDASAALWNEVNYERLMRYNDEDDFEGDVWDADTGSLEGQYKPVLGGSTAQQIISKNSEAWRSFFRVEKKFDDESNDSVTEHPAPPGFRGNKDDGRVLKGLIRKDAYSVEWGTRSRLEILVGEDLRDRHNSPKGRLRLEIVGEPNWPDYEDQSRLELWYDETDGTFRASQPVTIPDDTRATPLADDTAALDVGANNLVACTTTTGDQYLYDGSSPFDQFRDTTERIADLQSKLDDQQQSSTQVDRLSKVKYGRRDHAQDALVRDLVDRLYEKGVSTVYVGDLKDVLSTHWKPEVNAKTHNFWAFRRFINRLESVCEEYGIEFVEESESWTTHECPECGAREETARNGDVFRCVCGFEGHADLKASQLFLERETGTDVGLMAQPVCLEWDDHEWSETPDFPERASPKEERTDRSTRRTVGNVASVESA
ncbi:RNA-guided endonuclease TnpB family protein [Halorubrum sp. PV6]|uniref:RNA-guided endonuclease InsQ/TnpB family protein n=1 Tax=Halorubrum sp. PV6 TaxID=634157 RepID=UPI0011985442|nr:RNA-guided endonuclease TnpB family protein [Halorubrum sp. PV6]AZQ16089.1 transposase [Halorubrum sp. PV6]